MEQKRYIAIVKLKNDTDMNRLAGVISMVDELFSRFSNGEKEHVFRSNDGLVFGFFFKSAVAGQIMRAEFEKLTTTNNEDSILIFEAGELACGRGFSRAWTWLQHH